MGLRELWQQAWRDAGISTPDTSVFDQVLARYSESSRAYHTTQHLEECLEQFGSVAHLAVHPGEAQLALWFHDAVYDTRRGDNEERSAAWAVEVLSSAGASSQVQLRVRDLILATRGGSEPVSADGRLVVDVDLAILGAPPLRFEEYEAQIRREFSWVPDEAFAQARAEIVRGFLARPYVYATDVFRERLETQAQSNLASSLVRLGV